MLYLLALQNSGYLSMFFYHSMDARRKLNVHKTFRKRPGHFLNFLYVQFMSLSRGYGAVCLRKIYQCIVFLSRSSISSLTETFYALCKLLLSWRYLRRKIFCSPQKSSVLSESLLRHF